MKYSVPSRRYLSLLLTLAMFISYLLASVAAHGPRSVADLSRPNSTVASRSGASLTKADAMTEQRVREAFGKLPVSFEPNRGQLDRQVRFTARGVGYTLFLTATEAVFVMRDRRSLRGRQPLAKPNTFAELQAQIAEEIEQRKAQRSAELAARAVVRMKLAGANENPQVTALDELPGKVNHFWTNNPRKWATDVPLYAMVQYKSVYPGIDMVYHSGAQRLEYDFIVAPGADPNAIALDFAGAEKVEVGPEGELLISAKNKVLRQQKPEVYQEVNGQRQTIESRFVLKGQQVGFELGRYDASRPLVIDPVLTYSTFLGDEDFDDTAFDIAVDADGSAYVVGQTEGELFPTEDPLQSVNTDGQREAFITKFNPAGSALIFSTYLGGTFDEAAYGVALDAQKNIYLTGYTNSSDFPRQNAMQQNCGSTLSSGFSGIGECAEDEAFVTKIAAAGNHLVFSTFLGGSAPDRGRAIAVDSSNNVYVTGFTMSFNFPTTHPIQPFLNHYESLQSSSEAAPAADAFLTKIEPGGQFRLYSTFIGGPQDDIAMDVAVDSAGSAYLTGFTDSTRRDPSAEPESGPNSIIFPTTPGSVQPQPSGTGFTREAFVTKVNADGAGYAFSTLLGGNQNDEAFGIAVGPDNSAYITGYTESQDYPTTAGAYQTENRGGYDAFITRLDPGGSTLLYSSFIGGDRNEGEGGRIDFLADNFDGAAIAVDYAGNAYITGWTESTTVLPPEPPPPCSPGFTYTGFASPANLTLNGSAAPSGNDLRLTPDTSNQNGSAFYDTPVNTAADFTTTFGFRITVTDEAGAEGLAFNITNNGPSTLPANGEFGTTPDFSVSLQTFDTGNADTLRFFFDSSLLAIVDVTGLNLDNGSAHTMAVSYTGGTISVTIDGAATPAATASVDLSQLSSPTYVGFSARTSPNRETHDILSWSFAGASTCPSPPSMPLLNFPVKNAVQPNPGSAPGENSRDAFVAKFDTNSPGPQSLIYSTFLGGVHPDEGLGIAVSPAANAYVTGRTGPASECQCSPDLRTAKVFEKVTIPTLVAPNEENGFPTTPGSYKPSKGGEANNIPDQDAFVTEIGGGSYFASDNESGFSIGGLLRRPDGTTPVEGVTVNIKRSDNSTAGTATTDASGLYFVDGLAPGTYTVTPTGGSGNNIFSPASRTVMITNQNERADFTAIARFTISGRVTEGGAGLSGVTLTLGGGASGTTTTDSNGNYAFNNLPQDGNYTVTPSSAFHTFAPPTRTFNSLSGNQTNANFDATRLLFSISGRVTEGTAGLGGVTITVTRTSDNSTFGTATTASDGTYTLTGVPAGLNYTVTPSRQFYTFAPPNRSINSLPGNQTNIDFAATRQRYAIAGRIVTPTNGPVSGVTLTLSGDAAGTTMTDFDGQYSFGNLEGGRNYTVTPSKPNFSFAPPTRTITNLSGNATADFTATPGSVTFTAAAAPGGAESTRGEGDGSFHITVNRTGNTAGEMLVEYATFDGPAQPAPSPAPRAASERSDYVTSIGRLRFAPGETTKTISVFIVDDNFVEGNEVFSLVLSNPSNGGVLGNSTTINLTILDNDTTPPTRNPIDDPAFFVRQHYLDFLNREPDVIGFAGWLAILTGCPQGETRCDRIEVSSAFFRSEEFSTRSYFVYRFYSVAFGRIPHYRELMRDLSFVTGFLSEQELEAGKQEFIGDFMARPEFRTKFDPLTDPADYVNDLERTAGVTLPNKQQLIDDLRAGRMTRAQVLRAIVESREVAARYITQAFVVMEYFGYLRRDPDILYLNWIQTLNATGDYRTMVNGFMNSLEYRQRFGP